MRPRKTDRHLPPCVYPKHGAFWLVKKGKWTRLGADLPTALREYSNRVSAPDSSMAALVDEAMPHIVKKVKKTTAHQYQQIAKIIKESFEEFTYNNVQPKHVAQFRRNGTETPNYTNRALSVLRMVFDYAVEEQLVDSNPCVGIKRLPEAKRGRYITDAEYLAIYNKATPKLRVVMDLCYLTAQRPGDVLNIKLADMLADGIAFTQQKTGNRLVVRWTPELREVVAAAKEISSVRGMTYLLNTRKGSRPGYSTTSDKWDRACELAGVQNAQLRDLRAKSITDAQRQGHDPQAIAGHASAAMTKRYIRLRDVPLVDGPSFRQN